MGKETPLRQSRKTAQAGSKNKEEVIPKWALKKIKNLSKLSGISPSMILDMAIRFGLYQVKEELTPVINLMESARHLEDDEEPEPIPEPPLVEIVSNVVEHVGFDRPEERPDNASERRDEHEEGLPSNELLAALAGE